MRFARNDNVSYCKRTCCATLVHSWIINGSTNLYGCENNIGFSHNLLLQQKYFYGDMKFQIHKCYVSVYPSFPETVNHTAVGILGPVSVFARETFLRLVSSPMETSSLPSSNGAPGVWSVSGNLCVTSEKVRKLLAQELIFSERNAVSSGQ